MTTLLKQVFVIALGILAALVMVSLGMWQMQAFVDSGNRGIEERASQPAVSLDTMLTPDGVDGDAYGKQVTATGAYRQDQEVLIPVDGEIRVLSAMELADGRILPVVRGLAGDPADVSAPPEGVVEQTGLLLPGEGDVPDTPPGELRSVRMPVLAQMWPQQLVPGFITLNPDEAVEQGLTPGSVDLPEGQGSFQNGGYALQWWIFAAVGLGITIRLAVGIGRRDAQLREEAAAFELATELGDGPVTTDERTSAS